MLRASLLFLPLCSSIACSDAPAAIDDAGVSAFVPASHPAAPTVKNMGGAVLANPKIVVVTFSNDPLASQIETFAQTIGASAYWSSTTSEYGVGAAAFAGAVHVDAPPPNRVARCGGKLIDAFAEAS